MKRFAIPLVIFGFLTVALPPQVNAQSVAKDGLLEEVVVSARKKDETASDAPLSISVFGAEAIKQAGIVDVRDVAEQTPGLQFNGDFGRSSERPVIRGIANLRPETAQPVSLFIDGVYLRSGLISSITEGVERIEVLKGPQAALYGRSTYGGVVNYITKAPGDELEANVSLRVAQHEDVQANGFVSGKFNDQWAGTFGARYYEFGSEWDNTSMQNAGARAVGSEETTAVFGSLNFSPSDRLKIIGRAYFSEDSDGQFAGVLRDSTGNNASADGGTACPSSVAISYYCGIAAPFDSVNIATSVNAGDVIPVPGLAFPITAQWDMRAGLDREIQRFTGQLNYDISDTLSFEWLAGTTSEDLRVVTNQSYSPILVSNPFGSFPAAWVTDDKTDLDYYSHEFRLSGSRGAFDWLVGAFIYHEELDVIDRDILQADLGFDQKREDDELSIFARLGWEVSDVLALSVEARQSKEEIDTVLVEGEPALKTDFSSFNPRVTIDYQLNDDTLLYGNIARGSKAGGFNPVNPNNADELAFLSFDEEVVWQYEAGLKTTFADGSMRLTAAAFLLDLTDQQLSQVVILNEGTPDQVQITVVQNVGESDVTGLELDYAWQISDRWFMSAAYALADTEITEGTDATQALIYGDASLVGFEIPRVSKHSANAIIQYTHPFNDGWRLRTRLNGVYNSSRYAQTQNLQETGDQFDLNLRATLTNDQIDATFWVRNLLDDDAVANVFRYVDPGSFRFFRRGAYASFLGRGRQAGVTVRYSF